MVKTSRTFRCKQRGLFFLVLLFLSSYSMAQPKLDWLRTVDSLSLAPGVDKFWFDPGRQYVIDSVKKAGAGVIITNILDPYNMMNVINSQNLRVIVGSVKDAGDILNYIAYYTDAKYSVWEAEATPGANGDAVLFRNTSKTHVVSGNPSSVMVNLDCVADTFEMIYGPYYRSEVVYYTSGLTPDDTGAVKYTADFRLKLSHIPDELEYEGDDTVSICKIQVTYSNHYKLDTLGATYDSISRTLHLGDFTTAGLDQFYDHKIVDYKLTHDPSPGPVISTGVPEQYAFALSDSIAPGPRNDRGYMQYKVIWLGNPHYTLSVDKVIISDQRGRDLMDSSLHKDQLIKRQIHALDNYFPDRVAGWLAVDEPTSIDCYEPFRIVQDILDNESNYTRPLWIQNMGRPLGSWENVHNKFGAMALSPWSEFKKRVGHANIWQDFYYFDYPYNDTYNPPPVGDFRDNNITVVGDLNYKQAYGLDPGFGVSIQGGVVHHTQAQQRNINAHELLYETNLALMFGAKFITFYTFIAHRAPMDSLSGFTFHAVIDIDDNDSAVFTPKYYMVRDTISPRFHGLFGRTIKKLIPTYQYVGTKGISYHGIAPENIDPPAGTYPKM